MGITRSRLHLIKAYTDSGQTRRSHQVTLAVPQSKHPSSRVPPQNPARPAKNCGRGFLESTHQHGDPPSGNQAGCLTEGAERTGQQEKPDQTASLKPAVAHLRDSSSGRDWAISPGCSLHGHSSQEGKQVTAAIQQSITRESILKDAQLDHTCPPDRVSPG